MIALSWALGFSGFVCFSLAMARHHEQVFGRKPAPSRARLLRGGGWVLLALAVLPCVAALGLSVGLAAWCVLLTVAAAPLVVMLSYAPRWPVPLACWLPPLSLLIYLLWR